MEKLVLLLFLVSTIVQADIRGSTGDKLILAGREMSQSIIDFLNTEKPHSDELDHNDLSVILGRNNSIIDEDGKEYLIIDASLLKKVKIDGRKLIEGLDEF